MSVPLCAAAGVRRRAAFTLTELLMVLGIAVVVFALLGAALSNSLHKARQAECLTNLHNLSLALNMYVTDADGHYPPVYAGAIGDRPQHEFSQPEKLWGSLLRTYLRADFPGCAERQIALPNPVVEADDAQLSGYFYNKNVGDITINREKKHIIRTTVSDTQLGEPSRTVLIGEGRIGLLAASQPDTTDAIFRRETIAIFAIKDLLTLDPGGIRHNGGSNYVFADGHVRWHSPAAFQTPGAAPTFEILTNN